MKPSTLFAGRILNFQVETTQLGKVSYVNLDNAATTPPFKVKVCLFEADGGVDFGKPNSASVGSRLKFVSDSRRIIREKILSAINSVAGLNSKKRRWLVATTDVILALRSGAIANQYAGLVEKVEHGPFVILNYTDGCREWDEVARFCRGLIVDTRTWTVAAQPFSKFWNVGERPETQVEVLPREPFAIFEKVDGSLGVSYRDESGKLVLASRGSFTSDQALRGTQMLRALAHIEEIPESLTMVFEIVYRKNRLVVPYDFEGLVLLAIFNRESGEELPWSEVVEWAARLGCRLPKVYKFGSLEEALASKAELGYDAEGYVIRFASGLRVKIKGDKYLSLLRQAELRVRDKAVLEALAAGIFAQLLQKLPEELQPDVEKTAEGFRAQAQELETEACGVFVQAPKTDRKTYAIWVQQNARPAIKGALFQLLDGKEVNWYKLVQQ